MAGFKVITEVEANAVWDAPVRCLAISRGWAKIASRERQGNWLTGTDLRDGRELCAIRKKQLGYFANGPVAQFISSSESFGSGPLGLSD